jgi:hypothetical protein
MTTIGRFARHIAIRTVRGNQPLVLNPSSRTQGVQVSILAQSTSHGNLDDLDELATAYAEAWTTATAVRRDRLRNDLICRCLPFAGRMARRYAGRGEPFEDLQQIARIGLINAVDRYNPGRSSFTAFAVTTVCGELKRHFRDKTWGTHVTRRLRDLSVDLQRATATLMNALQREPTIDELAEHLDVSEEQIRHARLCGAGYTPVPLSSPTGNEQRCRRCPYRWSRCAWLSAPGLGRGLHRVEHVPRRRVPGRRSGTKSAPVMLSAPPAH